MGVWESGSLGVLGAWEFESLGAWEFWGLGGLGAWEDFGSLKVWELGFGLLVSGGFAFFQLLGELLGDAFRWDAESFGGDWLPDWLGEL